uniref:Putative ovule protein n=1 Tax=Solanum chacoense TaxID=4108 RepID=A0A0V0HKD8_SOLCH
MQDASGGEGLEARSLRAGRCVWGGGGGPEARRLRDWGRDGGPRGSIKLFLTFAFFQELGWLFFPCSGNVNLT